MQYFFKIKKTGYITTLKNLVPLLLIQQMDDEAQYIQPNSISNHAFH